MLSRKVDECKPLGSDMNLGFPDVWSAVQFAACCPREVEQWSGGQRGAEQLSAPAEFGDALPWCGWGFDGGGIYQKVIGV